MLRKHWASASMLAMSTVLMFVGAASAGEGRSASPPMTPAKIDALVARAMKSFDVPGVSVGIVKDGKLVFAKGYGVRQLGGGDKVDPDTIFGIGSNSKAFTAAALAILVDEKKIKWDDKVIDHLPDFRMYDPYVTREFTIRDLLTHRSGLPSYAGDLMFVPSSDFTRDEIIRSLRNLKPSSSFRTKYNYDNLLYVVAGQIIPAVTGQSWEDFVQARILAPLAMEPCAVNLRRVKSTANLASPHVPVAGVMQAVKADNLELVGPAGSMQCNLPGMAKWVSTLLAEGVAPDGKRLLSKAQTLELSTPQTLLPPAREGLSAEAGLKFQSYALGWGVADVAGRTLVYHDGEITGMSSVVSMLPEEKFGVIVLTNQQHEAAKLALMLQIVDAQLGRSDHDWVKVFKEAVDEEREQVSAKETEVEAVLKRGDVKPTLPLQTYAGVYRDPWRGDAGVRVEGDHLVLKFSRTEALEGRLLPYSGDIFVVRWKDRALDADAFVRFTQSYDRRVEGMTMQAISPSTDTSFDFKDLSFKKVD
ncbi:serine hydrolase [Caulobacter sp. CCUG 60055]|uniref:serine hydrolase n=1 Tax=Caulobacter sp. CCUG 60055 TaxID=2100090 RepID=UPI001FA7324F|nr:serine hydrolase [Caulobacter sp. CCUG 60055]MBQ1540740.1 serine hydrolase [Caulobacteraceae bacterium]MCI3178982.1 serine hydrolase [Caulobacter sp. CCUG 60055]